MMRECWQKTSRSYVQMNKEQDEAVHIFVHKCHSSVIASTMIQNVTYMVIKSEPLLASTRLNTSMYEVVFEGEQKTLKLV